MVRKVTIFFITSFDEIHKDVERAITHAIHSINSKTSRGLDIELITIDSLPFFSMASNVLHYVQKADIIVSNLASLTPNTMYEVGISHALKKPTILLIDNKLQIPFDLSGHRYFTYDNEILKSGFFLVKLRSAINDAIQFPSKWVIKDKEKIEINKLKTVFVSYSHRDASYLERLKIHLKPLERKGSIHLWSDTLIQSGEKWKQEIETALVKAAIAVLLISADFLASDFIINNELQPLLKTAEDKGTIIIPIVIKPCRFLREPSIAQFQAINDPLTPLCYMTEYEREDIYEKLSQRIELALESE
jgi:hypothetical protein